MKAKNQRRNYHRMRSRHGRLGLGYDRYEVLWRRMERIELAGRPKAIISRVSDKAMAITARSYRRLWQVDPTVFWQSPFVAKPEPVYKPGREVTLQTGNIGNTV